MKKIKTLFILMLALALMVPAVAHAEEDTGDLSRLLFVVSTGTSLPAWDVWQQVLDLTEIAYYQAEGYQVANASNGEALTIHFVSTLADTGVSALQSELVAGSDLADGKCLISETYAQKHSLQPGDKLAIDVAGKAFETEVGGVIAPLADATINEDLFKTAIFLTQEDFLAAIGTDCPDRITLYHVEVADAATVADFAEQANALLSPYGIMLLTYEQMMEMVSSQQSAGVPSVDSITAFDGVDLSGNALEEDLLVPGGITMVNVWATYCNPCIEEMPALKALSDVYAADGAPFRIIGICTDVTDAEGNVDADMQATAQLIVDTTGADYLHILPGPQLMSGLLMKVSAVPTTFFLNDQGEVIETSVGSKNEAAWKAIIDPLLEGLAE